MSDPAQTCARLGGWDARDLGISGLPPDEPSSLRSGQKFIYQQQRAASPGESAG